MGFIGKQPAKAAITSSDITDGIVTADKLASDSVTTAKIADNGVTTAKINADAITDAKIADDVVGSEHLTAGEVDTTALGADAVTAAKIADDAISDEHLDATAITGQTAETSVADDDLVLISDTSASAALKKMTVSNLVANAGGGKIGQVVSTFKSDAFSSTADGFFDITGLSVSITPSATSSKVLVISDLALSASDFASYNIGFKVLRGSTSIGISTAGASSSLNYSGGFNFNTSTGVAYAFGNSKIFLDSPSSTSSLTYKVQGSKFDSAGTFYLNRKGNTANYGGASSITVMEVLA